MAQFNAAGAGNPTGVPAPADVLGNYLDTANNAVWFNSGNGWQPDTGVAAKAAALGVTAAQNSLLVFTAPVSGLYNIFVFAAQATSTNGTLPSFTVSYTDLDTGATVSGHSVLTGVATTGQGQSESGQAVINAQAGTTITVASGAPTTLTANVKARISSLG